MGSDTANTKTVDESLWWDPFSLLLSELENAPLRPSSHLPSSLVNKLKKNHGWFLDSVSLFKRPSQSSKSALDSSEIAIGSHRLPVKPELKEVALEVSSCLCLDEAQSYILVTRLIGFNHLDADYRVQKFLHLILLRYSLERQCLLKCLRQILMHALYIGSGSHEKDAIREVALQLINDGLEAKLLSVLQSLLSSKHPERMEVDLVILWAEETLIEVNLVLDILFLVYYDYEIFCTCKCEQWKSLCSIFRGVLSNSSSIERLAISTEAAKSLYFAKVQLLLILIETLDLDNLLRMIHDEVPFRQDHCTFSLVDVQEMDVIVSSFNAMETAEAGPLILAWAVFLCLISSLPEKQDCNPLIEIDHVAYVRQAFEATPLNYILEIFYRGLLTDSDSPIAGYRSVLRTFISAFIASYEVTHQLEGNTFAQILDILFKIYHGEESLCIQFWDKDSFVDGPIRCLLSSLESEFPFRMVELFRLLSALCEGSWPAECVYNFLDKMVGITTLFEIPGDSCVEISQIIETLHPVPVPGVEGLLIPSGTCGHVLRVIDGNIALIRWENMQSGVFVLLLHLAREFHVNRYDDVLVILDLLCRMVSFNTALSFALMDNDNSLPVKAARMGGQMEKNLSVDAVRIICFLLGNLEPIVSSAGVMSMCISILTKLMKCSPSCVSAVALKTNMFGFGSNGSSSCMWLLSGGLARMLLYDCEQNEECCSLTISVLNFTMQLVETGVEDNMVSALVVFSLQYVLVNHENWKYKLKHVRWKVTLKVLEVMKKCIKLIQNSQKLGCLVRDIVLGDCSIHDTLCRIMCITTETLERMYVSRLYDLKEIEGLQLAVCSVIEIVLVMLADLSKDFDSGLPAFHQVMLSSVTKPIPVVTAMISWISFFRNPEIQVAAARVVSLLCITAGKAQTYSYGDVCIVSDDLQVRALTSSISEILSEEIRRNDDLFVAVLTLLTSAAQYQPAFLLSVMSVKEDVEASTRDNLGASFGPLRSKKSLMESILQYVKKSEDLIESHPYLLLSVLKFLKALWQGAAQYMQILETVKNSEKFWKYLLSSVSTPSCKEASLLENIEVDETLQVAFRYQCQSAVLDIMAHEVFLQKKMLRDKISEKKIFESSDGKIGNTVSIKRGNSNSLGELQDLLSAWLGGSVVENLVKLYASCGYDRETISCAKMAASLFTVHALERLLVGDAGSLSLSLVEKISKISQKLTEQPAFSELKAQYSLRGYSEGKDLSTFIFSDLYYHLQGEMEGREIPPSPFKELSLNLLQSEVLQTNKHENMEFCPPESEVYLFDLIQLCTDLGLSLWDHSDWKASKPIAERMLVCMRNANVMSFLADSKHSSLRSLMAIITVCEGNLSETKPEPFSGVVIEPLLESCINHLCKYLQKTSELFVSALHASDDVLYHLTARADLLLNLVRFLYKKHSLRNSKQQCLQVCTLVLKTSGSLLGVLSDIRPSNVQLTRTVKLFLTLLLTAIEFSYPKSHVQKSDSDAIDMFTEVSLVCLGLLPVLCGFVENAEYGNLSVAAIDMMLKGFLTYSTWLPILQTHLQLQHVQWKLQQKDTRVSVHVILKFLLTLARTRGGAEMLQSINLFASLKVLFALLLDNKPFSNDCGEGDKEEKPQNIWGVGLAIITAMICSLGDDPSCTDLVDSAIPFFFSEKSYLIFCYLSAPDFPTDDHSKKRARTQTTQTCLTALTQTEQTLTLICMLAKHIHSWSRSMKEMDSQLRERSIHLLAFISKGTHRLGESLHRTAPLLCTPILKEEVELNGRPAFVESKHGWFTLSALGCGAKTSVSSVSTMALSLPGKDQTSGRADLICRTYFTDIVAIQIYRIAFLLLKFLCLQAKAAAWRAEEVGFINLAHFPELPMPEILHGLQDQAIAIVTELCEANSSKTIHANTRDLCLLLLQIMEMALYLELCVSQTCEIRPVLGRVEDFSKEIKALIRATEKHTFFKASLKSVKQIITLLYPSLLQTEGAIQYAYLPMHAEV